MFIIIGTLAIPAGDVARVKRRGAILTVVDIKAVEETVSFRDDAEAIAAHQQAIEDLNTALEP